LGLYALALMHIVAHSLYKTYAFLSAGGTIEKLHGLRKAGRQQPITKHFVTVSTLGSLLICGGIAVAFGLAGKPVQLIALAIVLVLSIQHFLIATQRERSDVSRLAVGAVLSVLVCGIYFALHGLGAVMTADIFPELVPGGVVLWTVLALTIVGFAGLGVLQTYVLCAWTPSRVPSRTPSRTPSPWVKRLYVHLSNGLYINTLIDRVAGTWKLAPNATPFGGEKS
jgi:NAD(P)H-quinone oxidoreductase subunit 5